MFRLFALLAFSLSTLVFAQTTEADLRARLVKKPLYLRGRWRDDKLLFDDSGHLQGNSSPVTFTLSGFQVDSVKLTPQGLLVNGQRIGIEFKKDVPTRVGLEVSDGRGNSHSPERMSLEIQRPSDGDYTKALDAIVVDDLPELLRTAPSYWQPYLREHSLLPAVPASPPDQSAAVPKTIKPGGPISAPRLLKSTEPQFSSSARALQYKGKVLIGLEVDEKGKPSHLRLIRAAGLGLDEAALAAAASYSFSPAMEAGSPVAVELKVEVSFDLY